MKKLFIVLTMCAVFFVSGCQKNAKDNDGPGIVETKKESEIVVTCSSWSGWSSDYKPTEETFTYTVEEGVVVKPDNKNTVGQFEFKIINVTSDSITIKTNEAMSCKDVGDSGINLNSKEDTFEIKKGEKIQLTTLTMDCGDIYIIGY